MNGYGVKKCFSHQRMAKTLQASSQEAGKEMNAFRNRLQPFRPVINRVSGGHAREQGLRRADVAGGFLAADVLLAGAQRKTQSAPAARIFRDANEPPGYLTFERVSRGEEGRVRTAVTERHAKTLCAANSDVHAEFAGRLEQGETEQVGSDDNQRAAAMRLFDKRPIIVNRSECVWVLNQRAKNLRAESKRVVVIEHNVDAERPGAGLDDFNVLRMTVLRDEENVAAFLVFEAVAHHHRFRRGGGFVEQRGVGDFEAGEVADHRLKIQQHFQSALGNLGLIRRVLSVPAGILQNVALNHRRRDAIVVTQADERAEDLVFRCNGTEFVQNTELTSAARQIERALEPHAGRHCNVNQRVEAGTAQLTEHVASVVRAGADVSTNETVGMPQQFHLCGSGPPGFSG